MKSGLSEIVLVLDRSGSMSSTKDDAEGGLREFIARQRVLPGKCNLTFYRFDENIERVLEEQPLDRVSDRELALEPRGMTALIDAINRAIDEVGVRLSRKPEGQRPEKVFVVIITDGQENSSVTPWATVATKIKRQTDEYQWQFIFIGANQDAIATGAKLGLDPKVSMSYNAGSIGTRSVYASLTSNIAQSRIGGQNVSFTADQRLNAMKTDNPTGGKKP